MNKYQKALDYLKDSKCNEINNCEQCSLTGYCGQYQCIKTLQELVDKATPKKPIKIKTNYMETYCCQNCRHTFEGFSYCRFCGQRFEVKNE